MSKILGSAESQPNDKRDRFLAIRQVIIDVVRDPEMHESTPAKVARAVASGSIPEAKLTKVLDDFRKADQAGELKNPGAYFTACAKHLFCSHGLDWRQAWR